MSGKPDTTELFTATEAASAAPATTGPGTALAIPSRAEMAEILGTRATDFKGWVRALSDLADFVEEDKEDRGLSIVKAILTAETSEAVFAAMNLQSANDLCGTEPGGRSSVLEFTGATPLESKYEQGPSCFAIFYARDLAEGRDLSFSCGARAVQAAVIAHMVRGWMPFKASLVRRSKPTEAGFYPLNLESGV